MLTLARKYATKPQDQWPPLFYRILRNRITDFHRRQVPEDIDYEAVDGLSHEARQKLAAARPVTIGQASRLEGMTPSAVSLLLIHLKKRQLKKSA